MIRRFSPAVLFLLLLINNFGTGTTDEGTGKSLHYNGCFSKVNLDVALKHASSKLTWFKNDIENNEDCARTCQGFGLVGIQRQFCLCIQLSDDDKTKLFRISDNCCNNDKTNDATHFAGFGTFSLYCNDSSCSSGFENSTIYDGSNQCKIVSPENRNDENYNTLDDFTPHNVENENINLRFNKDGEVCQNGDGSYEEAIRLFMDYIPDLKEKRYLCKEYCDTRTPEKYDFSIVEDLYSSQLGQMGMCQCTKDLFSFRRRNIEIGDTCSNSGRVYSSENPKVKYELFCDKSNDCEINSHKAIKCSPSWRDIALYILAGVVTLVVVILLIVICCCESVQHKIRKVLGCPKIYDPVHPKPWEPRQ